MPRKIQWGIWIEDIESYMIDSYTKESNGSYTPNYSLFDKEREAKRECKALNSMWKGRDSVYSTRKFKKPMDK
jgi:hypothetical protein